MEHTLRGTFLPHMKFDDDQGDTFHIFKSTWHDYVPLLLFLYNNKLSLRHTAAQSINKTLNKENVITKREKKNSNFQSAGGLKYADGVEKIRMWNEENEFSIW